MTMKLSIASVFTPCDDDGEALALREAAYLEGVCTPQGVDMDEEDEDAPKPRRRPLTCP
jgi:hypothetical protein